MNKIDDITKKELYEAYKREWIETHANPNENLYKRTQELYHTYCLNEGTSCSFEDYVEEFGFADGSLYVCYEEFVENELNKAEIEHGTKECREDSIRVLYIQPGMTPQVITIENSLEAKQNLVGGYIEYCAPFEDEVAILCNEEGKIMGLEPNRGIYNDEGMLCDVIHGPFFLAYAPIESEHFFSLSEEQIEKYETLFHYPEMLIKANGQYYMCPYDNEKEELSHMTQCRDER